jgi:hypothetical protein
MSPLAIQLVDFVAEMERRDIPPFRPVHFDNSIRIRSCAHELKGAAYDGDAKRVAWYIRQTRLERLWRIESWLTSPFTQQRHPKLTMWLHQQLVAIGWRQSC